MADDPILNDAAPGGVPTLRRVAGLAVMALGGFFLLFLMWKLRGHDDHVRAFKSACAEVVVSLNATGKSTLCDDARAWFFRTRAPAVDLLPEKLAAPDLPVDSKVRLVAYQNPRLFAALGYCYFKQRGWLEETEYSPSGFAGAVGGLAILANELHDYNSWMRGEGGAACRKKVEDELGFPVPEILAELRGAAALIALNPAALVRGHSTLDKVIFEAAITVNHERIHAIQALCREFQEWSELEWEGLKEKERKVVRDKHPEYNWSDPFIAAREYAAFRFESHPIGALPYFSSCKL